MESGINSSGMSWSPLLGLGLACVLVAGLSLALAARRLGFVFRAQRAARAGDWAPVGALKAQPWLLEALAILAPVAIAVATGVVVQRARLAAVHSETASVELFQAGAKLQAAVALEIAAINAGIPCAMVAALLGAVTGSFAVSARGRAAGLRQAAELHSQDPVLAMVWARHPGPHPGALAFSVLGFLLLGLAPVVGAYVHATTMRIERIASLEGVDPAAKMVEIDKILLAMRATLDHGLHFAHLGLLVAVGFAAGLGWWTSATRARAAIIGGTRATAPAPGIAVMMPLALLAAGVLVALAEPLRHENATPWPPRVEGMELFSVVNTPALEGPDEVERGPVLQILAGGNAAQMDGQPVTAAELEERLAVFRTNFALLHPNEPFAGRVILLSEDVPTARLLEWLGVIARSGYLQPAFGFLREVVTARPLVGNRRRTYVTGADVRLVPNAAAAGTATVIGTSGEARYAGLAARIVEARRRGAEVALVVPAAGAPH